MRHFSGDFEGVRLLMGDELEKIAGGEAEDTDDVREVAGAGQWLGQLGIAAVGAYLGNQASTASQHEARIGDIFDPRNVARHGLAWQNEGGESVLVPTWEMKNNNNNNYHDTFIDTNHNNRPDVLLRRDDTGATWTYNGSTWTQIYSPGT